MVAVQKPGEIRPGIVRRGAGRVAGAAPGGKPGSCTADGNSSDCPSPCSAPTIRKRGTGATAGSKTCPTGTCGPASTIAARIVPVVGDLTPVVIAHHVGPLRVSRAERGVEVAARLGFPPLGLHDEPIHLAAVDVPVGVAMPVRSTGVPRRRVVVRVDAVVPLRIGKAGQLPGIPREAGNPVRSRIRTEVGVERAVLLHDDHHVPDLVDRRRCPVRQRPARRRACVVPTPGERDRREQETKDQEREHPAQKNSLQSWRSLSRRPENRVKSRVRISCHDEPTMCERWSRTSPRPLPSRKLLGRVAAWRRWWP